MNCMQRISENGLRVSYCEEFYDSKKATFILNELSKLKFEEQCVTVYGRTYIPKRKICAYGDDGLCYSYCGMDVPAIAWTPLMLQLKEEAEYASGEHYNYALLNYYPDGSSGIGNHRDNEPSLQSSSSIATISLGATRTINFYRQNCLCTNLSLTHGSLYIMHPPTNQLFTHGIRPKLHVKHPRISVTFRRLLQVMPPSKRRCLDVTVPLQAALEESLEQSDAPLEQPDVVETTVPLQAAPEEPLEQSDAPLEQPDVVETPVPLQAASEEPLEQSDAPSEQPDAINLPLTLQLEDDFTNRCIMFSPAAFIEFMNKLEDFNFVYKNSGFIANNEVMVLLNDGYCKLYQINRECELEPAGVHLQEEMCKDFCEKNCDTLMVSLEGAYEYEHFISN
ncbi:uncharacterized protein LOC129218749 [Uloborus diversus]|uniref:uncharacterized protein LOC129218749 n=1 Tax=Uloborus diversus TaxID=327109 RepID=UPI00240A43C5|nr:uncharacterized protein LOC129218749 [Uloborus diversus]